jgi:hypothetical protein
MNSFTLVSLLGLFVYADADVTSPLSNTSVTSIQGAANDVNAQPQNQQPIATRGTGAEDNNINANNPQNSNLQTPIVSNNMNVNPKNTTAQQIPEVEILDDKPWDPTAVNMQQNISALNIAPKNEPVNTASGQGGAGGSDTNKTATSTADAANISQMHFIEQTFDQYVPVAVIDVILTEQPILIQSAGLGLGVKQSGDSYAIDVASVSPMAQEQTWRYRSNGLIVNDQANQCLWRMESGGVGLCGCDDSHVAYWNVDLGKGIYTEHSSNQVLFLDNSLLTTKSYAELTASSSYSTSNAQWSTYRKVQRSEYQPPALIKLRPSPSQVLSIQQSGFFLVAQRSAQQAIQVSVTKTPPQLQYQTWVLLENGKMKNMEFAMCLTMDAASGLILGDCEDQKVGVWEYRYDLGVFREQTSNRALCLEGETVSMKEFAEQSVSSQYKWQAYGRAAAMSSESSAASNIAAQSSYVLLGFMSLYSFYLSA